MELVVANSNLHTGLAEIVFWDRSLNQHRETVLFFFGWKLDGVAASVPTKSIARLLVLTYLE